MSCFWSGLINILNRNGLINNVTPDELLGIVKYFNKRNCKVSVNGVKPTLIMQRENIKRINEIKDTNNGYDCSSFDPVLMLICKIYKVNINHNFNGTLIKYTMKTNNKEIVVHSNLSHFWS